MRIRFGFVAMSVLLEKASPSGTVTYKSFAELSQRDSEAALNKIRRVTKQNLHNTLRLLRYCLAHEVCIYRFTSKLFPLVTHTLVPDWDYLGETAAQLQEIGDFIKEHSFRVTFHPDHFTLLNSPREEVITASIMDLAHHCKIFEAMGLDRRAKLVIHVGGGYKGKETSLARFAANLAKVPDFITQRLTLENDDKTFTAGEVLGLCEKLGLPMVLDIHHHRCNPGHEDLPNLIPRFFQTWDKSGLPPKIHVSSPRSPSNPRNHHDFIEPEDLYPFLRLARNCPCPPEVLDVMVEAKQKDRAMLKLVEDIGQFPGVKQVSQGELNLL